ncbi:MAG: hypothetical protein U0487_00750 [Patescibacteria group bacterium]
MASPTPEQQNELKKAYLKLAKDLHAVEQTFIERAIPVMKQVDEKVEQAIRDHIKNTPT